MFDARTSYAETQEASLEFPQNRERKAHNKEKPEQEDGKCSDVRKIKRSFQKIGILKKPLVRLG